MNNPHSVKKAAKIMFYTAHGILMSLAAVLILVVKMI